jgi:hypothetical protein
MCQHFILLKGSARGRLESFLQNQVACDELFVSEHRLLPSFDLATQQRAKPVPVADCDGVDAVVGRG